MYHWTKTPRSCAMRMKSRETTIINIPISTHTWTEVGKLCHTRIGFVAIVGFPFHILHLLCMYVRVSICFAVTYNIFTLVVNTLCLTTQWCSWTQGQTCVISHYSHRAFLTLQPTAEDSLGSLPPWRWRSPTVQCVALLPTTSSRNLHPNPLNLRYSKRSDESSIALPTSRVSTLDPGGTQSSTLSRDIRPHGLPDESRTVKIFRSSYRNR